MYNTKKRHVLFEAYLSLEMLVGPHAKVQQVMRYASYLDPDFIPIFFFESLLDISDEELEDMLELLERLALINLILDQEGKKIGIQIHRNIQETCKSYTDWVDKRTELEIVISILEFLSRYMPDVTTVPDSSRELARIFAPHAAYTLAEEIVLYHPLLVGLLYKMSAYSREVGNPEQARNYHEMALIIDGKVSSKK
jgi:hypothetical protein